MVFTVALAAASARYQWDPDNVMAPLVTATGDLITLPTLYLATLLLDVRAVVVITSVVAVSSAGVSLVLALRSRLAILEEVLLNVMYDVPSRTDVAKVVISGEVVRDSVNPTLVPREAPRRERREKSA